MALVADAFDTPAPVRRFPGSLPLSVLAHGALLVAALWLIRPAPIDDAADLESIAVNIVTMQTATDSDAVADDDATQLMVAAGSVSPAAAEPVQQVQQPDTLPPIDDAIDSVQPETLSTIPATVEDPSPEPVTAVAPIQQPAEVQAAEQESPTQVDDMTPVGAAGGATPLPIEPVPQLATTGVAELATAEAVTAQPADARATVVAVPSIVPAAHAAAVEELAPSETRPLLAQAAKTKPKTKPPAKQRAVANAGSGGKSDASAAASSAKPGGAGRIDAGGAADISRYPGLVQAKLKRALRFPSGAGNARGVAQVRFLVAADGSVSGIEIVKSTGSAVLDEAARATVQRAAPFPPIPASAQRGNWSFTMPLQFRRG
jgi:protein TonB